MEDSSLVSVIVSSYKNSEYLDDCLDSIFSQTYDNIELIVSNDCSDDFDENAIRLYIENNKTDIIRNVIINKNERNLGTVKHCNTLLNLSSGNYVMFIACDDAYNNSDVIKAMVNGFKIVPADVMSIVGQTEMRDKDLNKCMRLYTDENIQRLINSLSPYEFYENYLTIEPYFPGGGRIYKKEAFEKYGKFDEKYYLVEDWTSSIMHAKQGMRTYFLDIHCINHRDGGVSHSARTRENFAHKMLLLDLITLCENILADPNITNEITIEEVRRKLEHFNQNYSNVFGIPIGLIKRINSSETSTLEAEQMLTQLKESILEMSVGKPATDRHEKNEIITKLEARLQELNERLIMLENSTLWRLTKPIRKIIDTVRRVIQRN